MIAHVSGFPEIACGAPVERKQFRRPHGGVGTFMWGAPGPNPVMPCAIDT